MCTRSPSGPATTSRRAARSSETANTAQAPATAFAVAERMRGERSAFATSVPCAVSAYGTRAARAARRAIVPVGTR